MSDSKFFKEFNLGFQSFVMVDAHHHEIALAIRRQIDGFILFVADGGNFSGPVA